MSIQYKEKTKVVAFPIVSQPPTTNRSTDIVGACS